jgi:hypothetical protein
LRTLGADYCAVAKVRPLKVVFLFRYRASDP